MPGSFPTIIPEDERRLVAARRFDAYTAPHLAPLPDEGPYPGSLPQGGFDPNAAFSLPPEPESGGFMPGATAYDAQQTAFPPGVADQSTPPGIAGPAPIQADFQGQVGPPALDPSQELAKFHAHLEGLGFDTSKMVGGQRPAGEGASVGGRWGRPISSGLEQSVEEATRPAFDVLNRIGVGAQRALSSVPSPLPGFLPAGADVVGALQEAGRANLGNVALMQTPDAELTPAQVERKRGLGLDLAMGVSGGAGAVPPEEIGAATLKGAAQEIAASPGGRAVGALENAVGAVRRTVQDFLAGGPGTYVGYRGGRPGATGTRLIGGTYVAQSPAYAKHFADWEPGGVVQRVEVDVGRPFNLQEGENALRLAEAEVAAAKRPAAEAAPLAEMYRTRGLSYLTPWARTWLEANGYDAVVSAHDLGAAGVSGPVLIALDPRAVRFLPEGASAGQVPVGAAVHAGGAVAGGLGGYATAEPQQPGESDRDYALRVAGRTAAGAVLGGVGGMAATSEGRAALRGLGARAKQAGIVPGLSLEEAQAPAAQELERLRLDKFPEGVRDDIAAAAGDGNYWRTQRRGVIPDAEAERMADDAGRTIDQMIAGGKAGKAYNTEQTRAVRNALVAQTLKVQEIARQVQANPTDGGLVAEQIAEGMKLGDLSRVAEGARAEAGRSLRAYQAFAREFAADPVSAVQRIYRANNLTAEQATQKVAEFTRLSDAGADPFEMGRFWARLEKPPVGFTDWFTALRYNAMLSGPRTLLVNTLGNATEIPWRGLRDVGASVAKGRPEEISAEAAGLARGFQRGLGNALEVLRHGVTPEQALAGDVPRSLSARLQGPARGVALGLEAPGRAMQATDELFRQMAYGMALGRQSAIEAGRQGLRGKALLAQADEIFADPPAGMMKTALAIADRMTYKGELGPIAHGLEGVQRIPVLGNIAIPFLRTIAHITNRGIERSPLGLVGTGFDVLRGAYRGGRIPAGQAPLGERLPDNLIGTAAFAGLAYLAAQGRISGAGPQDPEIRDMMRAQGWQPYSVKLGDRWVGYQQFGPLAIPLSLAAATAEAPRYAKADATSTQVALDAFRRGAQILAEQPYLQGVGAIYKGISEPDKYGEQWVQGFLQTLVPYGAAINTLGQALDPMMREPARGNPLSALRARLPETPFTPGRQGLPVRQDVLGRPVPSDQSGARAVLPVRVTTQTTDATLQTLLDAGVQVPDPPRTVNTVPLSQEEQRAYQRVAGEEIDRRVQALTRSASWDRLGPERKQEVLKAAIAAAREKAAAAAQKKKPARSAPSSGPSSTTGRFSNT